LEVLRKKSANISMDFFVKKKDSPYCEKNLFFDKAYKASLQHEPFFGSLIPAFQISTCSDSSF
jgi:hypothetical protein